MSKPPPIPLPSNLRRSAREHTALPVPTPKARRTREEIDAEAARKDSEKKERELTRQKAIRETAELEAVQARALQEAAASAHHPPPTIGKKVSLRPRNTAAVPDPEPIDSFGEVLESSGSSEDYEPDAAEEADGDEDEDEELLDNSSQDEDQSKRKARKPKKATKGDLRKAITEVASQNELAEKRQTKRKADDGPEEVVLKKKKASSSNQAKTGVRKDWKIRSQNEKNRDVLDLENEDIDMAPPSRPQSAMSDVSMKTRSTGYSTTGGVTTDDQDDERIGGISSDEDGLGGKEERQELEARREREKGKTTPATSIARVVPTTSVPAFIPPNKRKRLAENRVKKHDIRLGDIDDVDVRGNFDAALGSRLVKLLGVKTPWEGLSDDEVDSLWEEAFPQKEALGEARTQLRVMITKLLEDRVTTWRNRFAAKATTYFKGSIAAYFKNSEDLKKYCVWALEGPDNAKPYFFREYDDSDPERPKATGLFQSPLIIAAFATHLKVLRKQKISDKDILANPPISALVMSVLAAQRTIIMHSEKGIEVIRPGRQDEFSKLNWEDRKSYTEDGKPITEWRTGMILSLVKKLPTEIWKKVLGDAHKVSNEDYVRKGRTDSGDNVGSGEDLVGVDMPPDLELVDDDITS